MEQLRYTEVLPYRAADLIALVMEAERYKEFSSWIKDVQVEDIGRNTRYVEVLFDIPALPFAVRYACELQSVSPDRIRAVAVKSPFKVMEGEMTFRTLPNGHTEVGCVLNYRTGWNPVAIAASKIMESQIGRGIEIAKNFLAQRLTPAGAAPATKPPAPGA